MNVVDHGIRYLIFQLERCEKTRKLHIQAYIELFTAIRLGQLKRILADREIHAEIRGSLKREPARDYCMKEDSPWFRVNYPEWQEKGFRVEGTTPVELGKWQQSQGRRTDLIEVGEAIKLGRSERQICADYTDTYIKYHGGIRRARQIMASGKVGLWKSHMKIIAIHGHTGSGKSKYVTDTHGYVNVFTPTFNGEKYWFDGYDGQKVLHIEEFYGQVPFHVMQNLLDKKVIRCEDKGSMVIADWDYVYLTSNMHPKLWWNRWEGIDEEVMQSFMRRIDKVKHKKMKKVVHLKWEDLEEDCTDSEEENNGVGEGITSITPSPTYVPCTHRRVPEMFSKKSAGPTQK